MSKVERTMFQQLNIAVETNSNVTETPLNVIDKVNTYNDYKNLNTKDE
jgi:hypothetical protein